MFRHYAASRIIIFLVALASPALAQAAASFYAVDEVDQSIRMIETATGVEINSRNLIVSGVTGINRFDSILGAAINPLTGVMYAIIDLKDKNTKVIMRKFVTLSPRGAVATDIAVTDPAVGGDLAVGGLAFAANGTLYGITTDGADQPSTLYTIDLTTGVFTQILVLGNGLGGETIAFNTSDGMLYHASGLGVNAVDKVFESIDLNTLTVTNIALSGDTAIGLQTMAFAFDAAQNRFIGFRNDGQQGPGEYFSVTPGGVETLISAMPFSEKSIAFLDTDSLPPVVGFGKHESHIYAIDRDGPYLSQLDPATGAEIDLIRITLPGVTLQGASGLAMNPLNGEFFATLIELGELSNHLLVRLDPRTGVATLIGATGHILSGITFDSTGTLYAVSADNDGFTPSWLFSLNTTNAFVSILFNFGTANTPGDGEIIAFNTDDGLLYHASGGLAPLMETIDLTTGTFDRATVGLSGGTLFQASALDYDPLRGIFLGANADGGIFSMTPGGFVSSLAPARAIPLKGLGVITPSASGDQGGDRKSDILWRNNSTGLVWSYQMNGPTIGGSAGVITVADLNWQVAGRGDYNGDSHADILWRNSVTGQNWLYLMSGTAIDSSLGVNTVPVDWQVAGSGDYNGDGNADILWRNLVTGQNWLYLMNGASISSSAGVNTVSDLNWQVVGNGDYDGDGNADILWRNSATGQNWMYLMSGATINSSAGVNTVPADWQVVSDGDYDADGKADVLWRNSVTGQNWLYLMNGAAIASSVGVNSVPTDWQFVDDGDYNGDGNADILWRNTLSGQNWMYLMTGAAITSSIEVNIVPDSAWEILMPR